MSFRAEVIMDRIIEEDCSILIVMEMTLGEETLGRCKIIEVRVIEVDVKTIIGTITEITTQTMLGTTIEMTIMEEVEVGLEKDSTHVILEGMIEAVADLDQVQEPVQVKTELDVLNVEDMTILLVTVLTQTQKEI